MVVKVGKAAGIAALLLLVESARHRRAGSRSFAGVPVHNYRADAEEWMFLFREGTSYETMLSICKGKCKLMGNPNKGGTAFAKVYANEQEVVELVSQSPDLMDFVEPDGMDYMIPEIEVEPVEMMASSTASWGLERIGVPTRTGLGSGVHVYVQDTGIRGSHEDFEGRVIPTLDLTSDAVVECAGDANCARDGQGHGTHCAGTVAGKTFGVASGATVHAVKSLADNGGGKRSWQISAIEWITTTAVKPSVLSMSLGSGAVDVIYTPLIDAATQAGVTVVVAAGNSQTLSCRFSPAFVESAITVGATDSSNRRAGYSNYGTCNNIMAPGSAIISAGSRSDTGTLEASGTSMACPHVSGAAALLIESGVTSRDEILASMEATGRVGFVQALRVGDPDMFLWVGRDAAPAPAPTPAPPTGPVGCPSYAKNKDWRGNCVCNTSGYCSRDGGETEGGCPTVKPTPSYLTGNFDPKCSDCYCYWKFR